MRNKDIGTPAFGAAQPEGRVPATRPPGYGAANRKSGLRGLINWMAQGPYTACTIHMSLGHAVPRFLESCFGCFGLSRVRSTLAPGAMMMVSSGCLSHVLGFELFPKP